MIFGEGWKLCDFDHLIFDIGWVEHLESILVFSINFLFIKRDGAFKQLAVGSLNTFFVDNRC